MDYATADGTATTADNDYETASGTVTFDPGDQSKTINVTINGDIVLEENETYSVDISNAVNATITDNSGAGTITNDDGIMASIDDITLAEADAGITAFVFSVTMSEGSNQTITVDYTTTDGTATVADSDYILTAGTLTFNPWDVTKTITVNANDDISKDILISITSDTVSEIDETFTVDLSNPTGGYISIADIEIDPQISCSG
ncbi:Calx-beta domain-containing protein [Planctomycetota bacterium]